MAAYPRLKLSIVKKKKKEMSSVVGKQILNSEDIVSHTDVSCG